MDDWDHDLYMTHRRDYDERLRALVGTAPMRDEQRDALINAMEDVLDTIDPDC